MKILMLNYEFPPLGGGAGNALFYILREFSGYSDLHVDLITASYGVYREESYSENIKIYFLDIGKRKNPHYQTCWDLLAYTWRCSLFCGELLKKKRYDLCHAFFGIPCGFIAMKLKVPYIVSLRGSDVPYYNLRFYWLDRLFFRALSGKIWRGARKVTANSNGLKMLALRSHPSQKIEVICNGVDTEKFRPDRHNRSDVLRVLCVSRLIGRKGIEYLIKALAELKRYNIELVIAGEGDRKEKLEKLASGLGVSSSIEFRGYVAPGSLPGIYNSSDVFVLPSLSEGMSNAVLEAMACGLPVVITDTGGTSELLDGNGFIIEKNDSGSIVTALRKFLNSRELITRMGARSREIALSMGWREIAEKYRAVYRSLPGSGGKSA